MKCHLIGRTASGVRAIYAQKLSDSEFEALTKDGLPRGWFAFHLEENETVENSERVRHIATLAKIVCPTGCDIYSERAEYGVPVWGGSAKEFSTPMADVKKALPVALLLDPLIEL